MFAVRVDLEGPEFKFQLGHQKKVWNVILLRESYMTVYTNLMFKKDW